MCNGYEKYYLGITLLAAMAGLFYFGYQDPYTSSWLPWLIVAFITCFLFLTVRGFFDGLNEKRKDTMI